jgi:hypothetical protein
VHPLQSRTCSNNSSFYTGGGGGGGVHNIFSLEHRLQKFHYLQSQFILRPGKALRRDKEDFSQKLSGERQNCQWEGTVDLGIRRANAKQINSCTGVRYEGLLVSHASNVRYLNLLFILSKIAQSRLVPLTHFHDDKKAYHFSICNQMCFLYFWILNEKWQQFCI